MKKSEILITISVITFGLFLRLYPVLNLNVSFHYDMSRDAFAAEEIWRYHHIKIQGPPTSTPGLYHGVMYYYLIAVFYFIGQGSPIIAAVCMSILNILGVIPIYLLARNYFKSVYWGAIGGILYAVSFEANQYAGWLSNPSPAILTVSLYFWGLYLWKKGSKNGFWLSVISACLSVQFQFFLVYLFVGIFIFKYIFYLKISSKDYVYSSIICLILLSSFLISAIKFNTLGQMIGGLGNLGSSEHLFFQEGFSDTLFNYINHYSNLFINNFIPVSAFLGGMLGILCLYISKKEKFIIFGLLLNGLIFIFGGHSSNYANVGIVTPAILSIIYLLKIIPKTFHYGLLILIIIGNIMTINKFIQFGQLELVIPRAMTLKNELALVDKTYQIADGEPFSINSVTLPLWTNTTWAYLYHWYGLKKYGYLPYFYGHDQIKQPGENSLLKAAKPSDTSFLILEPGDGIPGSFYQQDIDTEDAKTKLVKEVNFNGIKLQERKPSDQ